VDIKNAFANPSLQVFTDAAELQNFLQQQSWKNKNLLLMSSGNFGGINLTDLTDKILA
jgi:UDP-N-acetylmuramate: L-alanyl-gamma-D-glutamyl-meso-diaminopimelate ligase